MATEGTACDLRREAQRHAAFEWFSGRRTVRSPLSARLQGGVALRLPSHPWILRRSFPSLIFGIPNLNVNEWRLVVLPLVNLFHTSEILHQNDVWSIIRINHRAVSASADELDWE
jgi:hypothetical protein